MKEMTLPDFQDSPDRYEVDGLFVYKKLKWTQ